MTVVLADLEHIHRSIPKLQARGELPVPGYPGLAVDYQRLSLLENEGEKELKEVYDGKLIRISIRELLRGVEDTKGLREAAGTMEGQGGLRLAFSYSHKDEELRDQLETHLKLLQRQGFIASWHDRRILPGKIWRDVIEESFAQADIVLLLISADFTASDYCYEVEMKTVLERAEAGLARVVPVILRACDWTTADFGRLQALPRDGNPITSWPVRDEGWNDVAKGIRRLTSVRLFSCDGVEGS